MGNQPFNIIVILFWLATMSWLVVAKVLPPLRVGEPPTYADILEESSDNHPVCWTIRLQDRTIGWAATKIERRKDGIADLFSRVFLSEFPFEEVLPGWLNTLLQPMLVGLGKIDLEKTSLVVLDPLGQPVSFESRVRVGRLTDTIRMQGDLDGTLLRLSVQSGSLSYKMETHLPPGAMMLDELSPQARMPGLHVGQTWTVPMYNPMRPSQNPLEILQASVERQDSITWGGGPVDCRVIVYRNDAGTSVAGDGPRGRLWVSHDGMVLRQEVALWSSKLQFVRMTGEESAKLSTELEEDWTAKVGSQFGPRLLKQIDDPEP